MPVVRLLGGPLRQALGGKQVQVPGASVREVLDALIARGGEAVARRVWADVPGDPDPDLRVLVNGRSIAFLDGLDSAVSEDDTLTLHFAGARGFPGG